MIRKRPYRAPPGPQGPGAIAPADSTRIAALGKSRVPTPVQVRSRATLERILGTAERLLDTRAFEDLGMAELAVEAGCAVGTLYGRIPSKDALLQCLLDLYTTHLDQRLDRLIPEPSDTLPVRAKQVVDGFIDLYARHTGLVRTIALHIYRGGADTAEFRRRSTQAFRRAVRYLSEAPDLSRRDRTDVEGSAELALLAALACAQNRIVLGERSAIHGPMTQKRLRAELPRLIFAYMADTEAS